MKAAARLPCFLPAYRGSVGFKYIPGVTAHPLSSQMPLVTGSSKTYCFNLGMGLSSFAPLVLMKGCFLNFAKR